MGRGSTMDIWGPSARLTEACACALEQQVEKMFEGVPLDARELPVIGEVGRLNVLVATSRNRRSFGRWPQGSGLKNLRARGGHCRCCWTSGRVARCSITLVGVLPTRAATSCGENTACTRDRGRGTSST